MIRPLIPRAIFLAAALALTCLQPAIHASDQNPGISIPPLLDRYERGDLPTTAEFSALAAMAGDGRLLASLEQFGPEWLQSAGPTGIDRRRLALAAFLLETMFAQRESGGAASAPLIEWACARLREMPKPWPAERVWQIATVGLLENGPGPAELATHLGHARARFKSEPWFLLADAWAQRGVRGDPLRASAAPYAVSRPINSPGGSNGGAYPQRTATEWFNIGMDVADPGFTGRTVVDDPHHDAFSHAGFPPHSPVPPSPAAVSLRRARDDYKRVMDTPALAAEAAFRLAELDLAYGKAGDAVYHATIGLARAAGREIQYLGQVLLGRAREQQRRWDDAESAFRAALVAVPDGRMAASALARLLDGQGKSGEAGALRARTAGSSAVDPWETFSNGDPVPYAKLIQELRQSVR